VRPHAELHAHNETIIGFCKRTHAAIKNAFKTLYEMGTVTILCLMKVLSLLLCVFVVITVSGQDSLSQVPRHALKFSLLHVFNPEVRSIQLAYEYRFSSAFSVQLEGGYVLGNVWWSAPSADAQGYKFKEDVRWYFNNKEVAKENGRTVHRGGYLSIEFHQNRMTFTRVGSSEVYRQNGIGIKTGFIRYSSWRFLFDANVGLSLATTNMEPLGVPLNDYEPTRNGYLLILPIVGLRAGYWIR
jgi:hypothetical protein